MRVTEYIVYVCLYVQEKKIDIYYFNKTSAQLFL